jgi:ABC-type dipeptide/oligopeptide/nickel transport system ATPase component
MLDASVRGEILKPLVGLKDEIGMTLVLITHDLAWAIADRVAIMYLGKIVEVGSVQNFLTEALHPYTRSLHAVTPEVGDRQFPAAASTPAVRCCAREKQTPLPERGPRPRRTPLRSQRSCHVAAAETVPSPKNP